MDGLFKRTNMCGSFRIKDIGRETVINGWIQKRRNLGGLIFCDVRDRTGIVQVVFDDNIPKELFERADSLRSEFVVGIKGEVRERQAKNPDIPTGEIEIFVNDLVVYSKAETTPIYIKDDDNAEDNLRLKYRYLDLRKPSMQKNLILRHKITKLARDYFDEQGFIEVETPMLIKPTPEGARDYLVPSRISPGNFYALPQSPQMFKQLLMVSGIDRYFQIARCFRDEDLRADRQPEFTQIDMEMSFAEMDDIIKIQEGFLKRMLKEIKGKDIKTPFPRLTYEEAMERYGSDKPDTRFGNELKKLNETVKNCSFDVFTKALQKGGDVRGICIEKGGEHFSRKDIDRLTQAVKSYGASGLVWMKKSGEGITSSVNKFFSIEQLTEIADVFSAKEGDLILIVADSKSVTLDSLGFLRKYTAEVMGLLDDDKYELLWVTDFPLFEYDEEEKRFKAKHHPFTAPDQKDVERLESHPESVNAQAYDIVMNGVELGGGSIRIHDRGLQEKMFKALGISEEEARSKFGFLVDAFKYGAPPHGGLAYGLDRLVMLIAKEKSIREVIAFPKNQAAQCMVSGAPASADQRQLDELSIEINREKKI
ncbi:MAG TPA: aspartate--tRNA ligase [Bacillota bacterium]|nr:aspartate--tRNA ligase [Bacillota bacterium]